MNYLELLEKNYTIKVMREEETKDFHVSILNFEGKQIRYEIYDKDGILQSSTINIYDSSQNEDWAIIKTNTLGNIMAGAARGIGINDLMNPNIKQ